MRCILHIGTEKTGTSSIQSFLHQNRDALRSHGVLFAESVGAPNNRALPVAAYSPTRRDEYTQSLGIQTDLQLTAHQDGIIAALRDEVAGAGDSDTVIFSSEHIHSRLTTEGEVKRLHRLVESLPFEEIDVIVYLREQVACVESLYSTAVLFGGRTDPPPLPGTEEYWDNICDHRRTLVRYRDVFGAAHVTPRLFGERTLKNGSVVDDFLEAARLEIPHDRLTSAGRENEHLSALGIELLRRLNLRLGTSREDLSFVQLGDDLPGIFQAAFDQGRRFSLPEDVAEQYRLAFRESNEWTRREYFPERERLFRPAPDRRSCPVEWDDARMDQLVNLVESLLTRREDLSSTSGMQLLKLLLRKGGRRLKLLRKPPR